MRPLSILPSRSLVAALGVALLLAACSGGGDPVDVDGEGGGEGGDAAEDGGDGGEASGGTLVAALGGDPDQLDPHTTTSAFAFKVLENVYDTLVQPDAELEMQPALAEEWETSDDEMTWTFTLRDDVTFHDGSDLTADDVVASMERIKEEGANAFRLDAVEEVTAVDDTTVEFALSRPAPNLLTQIGGFKGTAIVPEDAIDEGSLDDEPVGTGPFELTDFTPGDSITLEAADDYWGGPGEGEAQGGESDLPYLDGVEFRIVPEASTKLTNLEAGEVDWIDTVPPQQISSVADRDDIELGRTPGNDYWYMATNIDREPYDDVRVRQAIAEVVDREAITEAAVFDAGTANQTAIPEGHPFYHDHAPYEADVEAAQALMDEAGVDELTMDLMVTNEYEETVTAAEVLASQLAEIGIEAEIRTEDFSTWLSDQGEGEFDAFILGWLGNIDADDFYFNQHVSDGSSNFHGYSNDEVDELLRDGRRETDEDARVELYDEAAELIVDEASYIYLYNSDVINAWSPSVTGYETRADNAVRFVETRLEQ